MRAYPALWAAPLLAFLALPSYAEDCRLIDIADCYTAISQLRGQAHLPPSGWVSVEAERFFDGFESSWGRVRALLPNGAWLDVRFEWKTSPARREEVCSQRALYAFPGSAPKTVDGEGAVTILVQDLEQRFSSGPGGWLKTEYGVDLTELPAYPAFLKSCQATGALPDASILL